MNKYLASICEMRPAEIAAAKEIRRQRRIAVIEAIIGTPILIAFVVLLIFI